MAIQLVFETHSTTVDNEQGRATGWLPGELSERGLEQARDLGLRRANDQIAAVFSSDLTRAVQTVAIAFPDTAIPVLYDWRLRSSPQLIEKASKILSDLGVQVRTNATIAAATEEGFQLKDGQLVAGGVFVWAGGLKARLGSSIPVTATHDSGHA